MVPMKTFFSKKGYEVIKLKIDGEMKHLSVHRLVAEAFIPNPENKEEVNHENGIKSKNHYENLTWATPKENKQHMYNVLNHSPVRNFRNCELFKDDVPVDNFVSVSEAARYASENFGASFTVLRRYKKTGNIRIETVEDASTNF